MGDMALSRIMREALVVLVKLTLPNRPSLLTYFTKHSRLDKRILSYSLLAVSCSDDAERP